MKGQASVIAMVVIFFLIIATIGLILYISVSYENLQKEYIQVSQILANKAKENLLIGYVNSSLSIYNAGSVVTTIVAILLINKTNVTIVPENIVIPPNSNVIIHVKTANGYVIVTSYGNSFYIAPSSGKK
ncbi:hypothetical protein SULI_02500 [Saccharolobus solfataricus]|uniref:Uncharacterized protein n=3 Tax=Saccharolobus solfataricus TaxID=2287 RepID=Q97VE4_SACS2|nr:hypothetical protein [Saccharolobus solfataricus]AAK42800.1 Hypothetical protein SSO2683 [Saccharolobus solfataricus P2]AKA72891.1 hypothetical protein SULB_0489 [Saccharolobus solfataricus]AKA75590.1 hypothetical protein SULC_0487 [Saccharolobus solfataricus]AKA78283.1 hypothetical protein SULA_0487 [Saccharolobus solfataricus]AZF67401.1 hypothetical protein SULG_02500 [Saccharolobus solfataricus]